jgi:heterotetrameric sarcosine oxidase gamma subunit
VVWSGLDQWFVMSPEPVTVSGAALTDQSDAWAAVAVVGRRRARCAGRLVPIDLRPACSRSAMPRARLLGHMSCLILRVEADRYIILVFRSMAASAAHDLDRAMRMVAARPGV